MLDIMAWDVLGGQAPWPMTNVRNLKLPQWKALAAKPENRRLVPLTEFCEWTPDKHQTGKGKPVKGEMWFDVTDQPVFAAAGFWQRTVKGAGFTMVTCDPNALVAPVHPKAMITILEEADWNRWLTGSYHDVLALQQPYPAELMTVRGPIFSTREIAREAAARSRLRIMSISKPVSRLEEAIVRNRSGRAGGSISGLRFKRCSTPTIFCRPRVASAPRPIFRASVETARGIQLRLRRSDRNHRRPVVAV